MHSERQHGGQQGPREQSQRGTEARAHFARPGGFGHSTGKHVCRGSEASGISNASFQADAIKEPTGLFLEASIKWFQKSELPQSRK